MKKVIVFFTNIVLFTVFCLTSFAVSEVKSISLLSATYYEAVETEEQIHDAVVSVSFTATLSDGTELTYSTKDGWSNGANYEVSAYIQNETDENFGEQQSLYIVIDGQEFWAGYTNVEVNQAKALLRQIVTLDGALTGEKVTIFSRIIDLFTKIFRTLTEITRRIVSGYC